MGTASNAREEGNTDPVFRSVLCLRTEGFRRMAWAEWSASQADKKPTVVCVHGLTRCGRDFDWLALHLSHMYRVVCPDVLGRGESEWLEDPQGYAYAGYMSDMTALFAALDADRLDWVGTSMGGLIGLCLAALPQTPIRSLVLNDVGPFVSSASLQPIARYMHRSPPFTSLSQAYDVLSQRYAEFGPMSSAQKDHLIRMSLRPVADTSEMWRMHYDPAIANVFLEACIQDIDLWSVWDAVRIPVLVLRGQTSTLLTQETFERMLCKDHVEGYEIPECGHAPSLIPEDQIHIIAHWLERQTWHKDF